MPDWSEWIHHLLAALDEPGSEVARRRRDLERSRAAFGPTDSRTVDATVRLGTALRTAGELEQARLTHAEALALTRAELGDDHPLMPIVVRELGLTLLARSELSEAAHQLTWALRLNDEHYGPATAESAAAAENLALAWRARGDLGKAHELQEGAVAVFRRALGDDDPTTLQALTNLASLLNVSGRQADAVRLAGKVARRRNELLHKFDVSEYLVTIRAPLTSTRFISSELEPGVSELREAFADYSTHARPKTVLNSWIGVLLVHNLVVSHSRTEQEEAARLAQTVFDDRREALGIEHPQTLHSLRLLSRATVRQDPTRGLEIAREAADRSAEVLGRGHLDTLDAFDELAAGLGRVDPHGARELREENLRLRAADEGILGEDQPPIENLAAMLTGPVELAEGELTQAPAAFGGPPRRELVRRTAHAELDPAREIDPGERFEVVVHVDCAPAEEIGSGELTLRPPPGVRVLDLRAWLVVSRHFEIEGEAIRALELDLDEESSPHLRFGVRALANLDGIDEEPEARVLFSYNGWPSGQVALPIPLAQPVAGPNG